MDIAKRRIREVMMKVLPGAAVSLLGATRKQSRALRNLARDYGQFASMRASSCIDRQREPIPWYTYPAIEYLSHLDLSTQKVLEYGGGNSTLWWARRCKEIVSIEDDPEWFRRISLASRGLANLHSLLAVEENLYVRQPYLQSANIIVIDGGWRLKCAEYVLESIQDVDRAANAVIFDNADWHHRAIDLLRRGLNWIQVDFHGFGPINDYSWTTSVFINPKRAQQLDYSRELRSICALRNADVDLV
jgi:hypothetical protein